MPIFGTETERDSKAREDIQNDATLGYGFYPENALDFLQGSRMRVNGGIWTIWFNLLLRVYYNMHRCVFRVQFGLDSHQILGRHRQT